MPEPLCAEQIRRLVILQPGKPKASGNQIMAYNNNAAEQFLVHCIFATFQVRQYTIHN